MNTKTASPNDFDEAAAAHAKVRAAIDTLCADYDAVEAEIVVINTQLEALPKLTVPFEDMKTGILDFVDASGKRYADDKIRKSIISFVTGGMMGICAEVGRLGKPLRYSDIEAAISGESAAMGWSQLLSQRGESAYDQVLYFCFAGMVKAALIRVMEDMTPEEFGYGLIHPDKIGTPRAERRALIESLQGRLADLQAKRGELAGKLLKLGYRITPVTKR